MRAQLIELWVWTEAMKFVPILKYAVATSICLFIHSFNKYVWNTYYVHHWIGLWDYISDLGQVHALYCPQGAGIDRWWDDNLPGQLSWAWWVREGLLEEETSAVTHNVEGQGAVGQVKSEEAPGEWGGPWKSVSNWGKRVCAGQEVRESAWSTLGTGSSVSLKCVGWDGEERESRSCWVSRAKSLDILFRAIGS